MHTAPHLTPTPSISRQHPPSLHAAAVVERVGSETHLLCVGEDSQDESIDYFGLAGERDRGRMEGRA